MTKELRSEIYKLALPSTEELSICGNCTRYNCICPPGQNKTGGTFEINTQKYRLAGSGISDGSTAFPIPGFLELAYWTNKDLYHEAVPYYYGYSVFHLVIEDFNFNIASKLIYRAGRERVAGKIRHLVLDFRGQGGWGSIVDWVQTSQERLSKECVTKLKGDKSMIDEYSRCRDLILRRKARGVGWFELSLTMRDPYRMALDPKFRKEMGLRRKHKV